MYLFPLCPFSWMHRHKKRKNRKYVSIQLKSAILSRVERNFELHPNSVEMIAMSAVRVTSQVWHISHLRSQCTWYPEPHVTWLSIYKSLGRGVDNRLLVLRLELLYFKEYAQETGQSPLLALDGIPLVWSLCLGDLVLSFIDSEVILLLWMQDIWIWGPDWCWEKITTNYK